MLYSSFAFGFLALTGSFLTQVAGSIVPAQNEVQLEKRQSGDFNISFGNGENHFSSDIPLNCVEGCIPALQNYGACTIPSNFFNQTEYCGYLCSNLNYTLVDACLNCVIANGEQDTNVTYVKKLLGDVVGECQKAVPNFSAISTVTASPTTTYATRTSFTNSTEVFPTWDGLTSILNAESSAGFLNEGVSSASGTPKGTGSGSATGSPSGASSGASSASPSAAPTSSAASSGSGSPTSSASASATASGAASPHVKAGDVVSWAGVGAGVLGILMA